MIYKYNTKKDEFYTDILMSGLNLDLYTKLDSEYASTIRKVESDLKKLKIEHNKIKRILKNPYWVIINDSLSIPNITEICLSYMLEDICVEHLLFKKYPKCLRATA